MTRDELLKIFDWLETTVNKDKLLYFKLLDKNQIGVYFKNNNQHLADFYINIIAKVLKSGKNESR